MKFCKIYSPKTDIAGLFQAAGAVLLYALKTLDLESKKSKALQKQLIIKIKRLQNQNLVRLF